MSPIKNASTNKWEELHVRKLTLIVIHSDGDKPVVKVLMFGTPLALGF